MRSCFGASTVIDERLLDSVEISIGATHVANYLSTQLRRRVGAAARRAPKQVITIPVVDSSFRAYFQSLEESCLWVHQKTSDESKEVWYSPYFQAGECLSRFETFDNSKNKQGVPIAAGSVVVFKAGDMCVLLPPFLATFKQEKNAGTTLYWSFTFTFQLGVVSASRQARLTVAPSSPSFDDKRWVFVPEYASIERHAEEHIQRICVDEGLCPTASSVCASTSWVIEADPAPNGDISERKCDKNPRGVGWLWSEIKHGFVMTKNKKHEASVNLASWNFRLKRLQDYSNRKRLEEENRKRIAHDEKMKLERRENRRRKKRTRLNVVLLSDDDALSHSSAESLTQSEKEWLRENNAKCARGY